MYFYTAVPSIDDARSSNAPPPPPPPPSGSASNSNSVIAGTVGFLIALVVVTPLIIVGVLLYLVYTRRIVIGRSRQGHKQTEKTTGMVEEHSITETVSLYEYSILINLIPLTVII